MARVPGWGRFAGGLLRSRGGHAAVGRAARRAGRFAGDRAGATSIEYGLICLLIFLAITAAIRNYTNSAREIYGNIGNAVANVVGR